MIAPYKYPRVIEFTDALPAPRREGPAVRSAPARAAEGGRAGPVTAPAIRIERVVEWPDTDAAGHYHHSSVIRWVEAAESELHLALGCRSSSATCPASTTRSTTSSGSGSATRWHRSCIAEVGRASLTYDFEVCRGEAPAARGRLVCVRSDPGGPGAQAWPDDVAAILRARGPGATAASQAQPARLRRLHVRGA